MYESASLSFYFANVTAEGICKVFLEICQMRPGFKVLELYASANQWVELLYIFITCGTQVLKQGWLHPPPTHPPP